MSLTTGTSPFGPRPAGRFNKPMPDSAGLFYLEPCRPRIRGQSGDVIVVDSTAASLLHEHGQLPVLYFPVDDVRTDLLEPNGTRAHSPGKGEATGLRLSVGDRVVQDAGWRFDQPEWDALAGLIAFYLPAMTQWWQEDEPMPGHARDPYHRIEVLDTSRRVRVLVEGRVLADTTRARALFESGLPTRWYIPPRDVDASLLADSATRTTCAYKGQARYVSMRGRPDQPDDQQPDLAWIYDEPLPDAARVAGYVCFWNERVDLEIDGEPVPRPVTEFLGGPTPLLGLLPPAMLERPRPDD